MIPDEVRFQGHWVVAAQGMGKTNLLLHMLSSDLQRDCSVIVMDAKGELTGALRRLNIKHKTFIDPNEPIAINPLDVKVKDLKRAVDQVEYLFGALLGAAVTPKQQSLLRSVLRACISAIPEATLLTVQDVINSGFERYQEHFAKLPADLQDFFTSEWKEYESTRGELRWRLRLVMENDLIRQMFTAPHTRFDIGADMNGGTVTIIDNSVHKLHEDGSAFIGRYFISRIWATATARQPFKDSLKKPVFVYIDEAHRIIDHKVAEIIEDCRSQKIGLILAHQGAYQIEDKRVKSALENCAIKMVNVEAEAHYFSQIMNIPQDKFALPRGQFACKIGRGEPHIIQVPKASLPFKECTPEEYARQTSWTKEMYGVRPPTQKPPQEERPNANSACAPEIVPPEPTTPKRKPWKKRR